MSILLEVNGQQYTQFESANVNIRLDVLTNTFEFSATSDNGNPLPFKGGEECKITIQDQQVLTGFIEVVNVSYSATSHNIKLIGRDKTADLLDSTLDAFSDLVAPITLKQIIERVISELNLNIEVIDETNSEPFNEAEDIIAPEPGQNAFEFIEIYSRKRHVLLTSNGKGDVVITDSSGVFIDAPIRHRLNTNENNVISADVSYDTTGRFNLYKFASSLNPIALNVSGETELDNVVNQKGQEIDSEIRIGRQLILISENPYSDSQNIDRAIWEANIRKARGRLYRVQLNGFVTPSGNIWDINKIVSVVDDFADINAKMLINAVNFNFDLSIGSQTNIELVDQNAYTLTLNEPRTENLGSNLFG